VVAEVAEEGRRREEVIHKDVICRFWQHICKGNNDSLSRIRQERLVFCIRGFDCDLSSLALPTLR
jgi:hypothetical protein